MMIELNNKSQQKDFPEIESKWLPDFDWLELYKNWDRQAQLFWEELAQQYRTIEQ